jgi:CPA2 family monovalent cation:H+ antiporter-2
MHLDPLLPPLVAIALAILLIGLGLRALRQPHVVAYLLAGVMIGPGVLDLLPDPDLISRVGALGVVLLLFFIGMEVSPTRLVENWRVAVLGTLLQIAASVACAWVLGWWLDWTIQRSILLGFVIALSSSAVVLKLLKDRNELDTDVGQDVLGVLLVQDMAVIPMLIVLGLLGGTQSSWTSLTMQLVGGVAIIGFVVWLVRRDQIRLPFARALREDHELQVFSAAVAALGLALLTGLVGLSTALGAFVGGMFIASARETAWVHASLEPFRVVFVAVFFVSVGALIDLEFLRQNAWIVLSLLVAVFATNTVINMFTLRMFGSRWDESLYGGALLAQIGEFSFVLSAVGLQTGIINEFSYRMTVGIIALSLLVSPGWIALTNAVLHRR